MPLIFLINLLSLGCLNVLIGAVYLVAFILVNRIIEVAPLFRLLHRILLPEATSIFGLADLPDIFVQLPLDSIDFRLILRKIINFCQ